MSHDTASRCAPQGQSARATLDLRETSRKIAPLGASAIKSWVALETLCGEHWWTIAADKTIGPKYAGIGTRTAGSGVAELIDAGIAVSLRRGPADRVRYLCLVHRLDVSRPAMPRGATWEMADADRRRTAFTAEPGSDQESAFTAEPGSDRVAKDAPGVHSLPSPAVIDGAFTAESGSGRAFTAEPGRVIKSAAPTPDGVWLREDRAPAHPEFEVHVYPDRINIGTDQGPNLETRAIREILANEVVDDEYITPERAAIWDESYAASVEWDAESELAGLELDGLLDDPADPDAVEDLDLDELRAELAGAKDDVSVGRVGGVGEIDQEEHQDHDPVPVVQAARCEAIEASDVQDITVAADAPGAAGEPVVIAMPVEAGAADVVAGATADEQRFLRLVAKGCVRESGVYQSRAFSEAMLALRADGVVEVVRGRVKIRPQSKWSERRRPASLKAAC